MRRSSITKYTIRLLLFLVFSLTGCSRGDVPLPTLPPTETVETLAAIEPTSTSGPVITEKYPLQVEYAAVWALKEEGLHVRNQAGISATVAEVIPWDSRQIYLTGNRSLLGSSLWLEIVTESSTTGWVSAWNLTEYLPSSQFCDDSQVKLLLDRFRQALQDLDGSRMRELTSPNRGLTIRLNWYSSDVTFAADEVVTIFSDIREMDWGTMADSGLQVTGSFEEVIHPKLEDVFSVTPEILCNELKWGSTAGEVRWPYELVNLNFYTFYRPAEEGGNVFDWRTWAVGIEYVNHQPFIVILIQYSSEL